MARDIGADGASKEAGFKLCCRGGVRLFKGDEDFTPRSKKGRALLAILAAEQRPLSRIKIIDLLWSDRQEEQARASLRTLLADLREQFGPDFNQLLTVDRERVELQTSVGTDLDDPGPSRCGGELFEGLDHLDPELDEWLRVERERWQRADLSDRKVSDAAAARQPGVFSTRLLFTGAAFLFLLTAGVAWWFE